MTAPGGIFDLKDENQAKEYLERINIEYHFQCLHEHRPDGCHRLADFFEAFRKEWGKARTVYRDNCFDNRYGHSCFKYGNYNVVGRGADAPDASEAFRAFQIGCDAGYAPSCLNAALTAETATPPDVAAAAKLLERGCTMKHAPSCHALSGYFLTGKDGVSKDMHIAHRYAELACDLGYAPSCINLGVMYKRGDGVPQNDELAAKYRQRAEKLFRDATQPEKEIKFGE